MALTAAQAAALDRMNPDAQRAGLGTELQWVGSLADAAAGAGAASAPAQEFFCRTVSVLPAQVHAGDGAVIVPAAEIPEGKAIHVLWFFGMLNGSTAWGSATDALNLKGLGVSGTEVATFGSDKLVANAIITPLVENGYIATSMKLNAGLPAGQGLALASAVSFTLGSPFVLTVYGYFA